MRDSFLTYLGIGDDTGDGILRQGNHQVATGLRGQVGLRGSGVRQDTV